MTEFHKPENFKVGDTWELQGNLHYADGTPFNLGAGCQITWGLENSNGMLIETLSLGTGITVLDAAGGTCLITLQSSQSAAIPVGTYTDQLQAIDPGGYVSTQWQGTINARKSFFV